jgi:hypothetical protein
MEDAHRSTTACARARARLSARQRHASGTVGATGWRLSISPPRRERAASGGGDGEPRRSYGKEIKHTFIPRIFDLMIRKCAQFAIENMFLTIITNICKH